MGVFELNEEDLRIVVCLCYKNTLEKEPNSALGVGTWRRQ